MKRFLFPLIAILLLASGCTCIPGLGNKPPVAYIDSMSPAEASLGEVVSFAGHGTDANGTVVGYRWSSSIDGEIGTAADFQSSSLSEGTHTIYLKVQDNNGAWSKEVEGTLIVGVPSEAGIELTPGAGTETPGSSGAPGALPYINYFTAEPASIAPGGSSRISWSVSNAESVVGSYDMTRVVLPMTGSGTVRPTRTTTYTLTATGGGTSVMATVDVIVSGAVAPPPPSPSTPGLPVINSFTASPQTISPGDSSTLSWNVSNATQLTLTSTVTKSLSSMVGSTTVSPSSTMTYTLTATNAAGPTTATAKVTVQTPTATSKTTTLSIVSAESGSINSDHLVGTKLITGDAGTNKTFWAYFSFNTTTLAGKDIVKAELVCSPDSLNGRPWPNLVSLGIYQINHGPRALKPSDFTFVGPAIREGMSQIQMVVPVDVTAQVQDVARARAPRFQVRINFVKMTDNNNQPDNIGWNTTTPKLRVTYRL
ncbi:MAG: hypothetical protein FJ008_06335 [Chloroflexi bacterium]|nr:hypothetical protein [Chloroflexota bacterium]MBM3154937.1 hypothetical protein [Chloroflexota bacterium]MBM3173567.1 hypothetical protein [Chloroflexota bacterium]MBM3175307.1 hypothetical protein [Chloroflexota bacterium]MBM4450566.1 hypothetical protein [Chloroflexota bacterium]